MNPRKNPGLVLAVHPTSKGFGWVVFEGPLAPVDWGNPNNSFDPIVLTTADQFTGNSLQFGGSLIYAAGALQVGFTGTYLDSPATPRSFSFGPSINWPIWNNDNLLLAFVANAARSNYATEAYVGLRVQFSGPDTSVFSEAGVESRGGASQEYQRKRDCREAQRAGPGCRPS